MNKKYKKIKKINKSLYIIIMPTPLFFYNSSFYDNPYIYSIYSQFVFV